MRSVGASVNTEVFVSFVVEKDRYMLECLCLTAWNANGDGDIIVICKLGDSVVIGFPKEETHVAFFDVNFSTSAVL